MARVSDWRVDQEAQRAHHPEIDVCVGMALDLRDARALLREALGSMSAALEEGEVIGYLAEGSLTVACNHIRQHLEGTDG